MLLTKEKLSEYILRPIEERTAHLDERFCFDPVTLTCKSDAVPIEECRPTTTGHHPTYAQYLKNLDIEDDVPNKQRSRIQRCHVCQCGSNKGWCKNPSHSFIGTTSENIQMSSAAGTHPWLGALYIDPKTGRAVHLTKEEAATNSWLTPGVGKGYVYEKQPCPYCGLEGAGPGMKRYHYDNCHERTGSKRWFEEQLKIWDSAWYRMPSGKWHKRKPRGSQRGQITGLT